MQSETRRSAPLEERPSQLFLTTFYLSSAHRLSRGEYIALKSRRRNSADPISINFHLEFDIFFIGEQRKLFKEDGWRGKTFPSPSSNALLDLPSDEWHIGLWNFAHGWDGMGWASAPILEPVNKSFSRRVPSERGSPSFMKRDHQICGRFRV